MDSYGNLIAEWPQLRNQLSFGRILNYYRILFKERTSMALCPFHDDHHPSMHIKEQDGLYHCFSCGASGDMISFIRYKENCNFSEAVKIACDICGISCQALAEEKIDPKYQPMYEANERACCYFTEQLINNQQILLYLKSRNIFLAQIEKYRLGYAPLGKSELLLKKDLNLLAQAELIDADGKLLFAHRVVFPIILPKGRIAGFGARSLNNNDQSKYINSKASAIFQKRDLAYNMQHLAYDKNKPIYIVEGYLDAIKLQELGHRAVALMGTSMSKELFHALRFHGDKFILTLDQDAPGMTAAENMINQVILPALNSRTEIYVASYRGKDPADAVDYSSFSHLIMPLATYCQFYIEKRHNNIRDAYAEFAQLSKRIPEASARETFRAQWERDIFQKREIYSRIEHIRADTYLKAPNEHPYLDYIRIFPDIVPQILTKLKSHYCYLPLDEYLDDFYHRTFIIANSDQMKRSRTISQEKYDWCSKFLTNVIIQECLKFLREKNKEIHSTEESTELLNTMLELTRIAQKQ